MYKLELPVGTVIHLVFHVSQLKLVKGFTPEQLYPLCLDGELCWIG